jgi:hypothetical protein
MTLQGKGWFIWQIPKCEGGSPTAIADQAVAAGCTHVLIKVAERTFGFGFDKLGRDLVPSVAEALRARGLQVWGWHYVYGDNPTGEANVAVQRCMQLKLDGYVIDAEKEYKQPGKAAAARTFMNIVRAGLPNTLIALSAYRYPSLHPELPWSAFLAKCDLNMPQVYWEQSHNPEQQLARSLTEFSKTSLVGVVRPVAPTGSAYGVPNPAWRATAADVTRFYDFRRQTCTCGIMRARPAAPICGTRPRISTGPRLGRKTSSPAISTPSTPATPRRCSACIRTTRDT